MEQRRCFNNLQQLRGLSASLIVMSHMQFFQTLIGTSWGGYGVAMFFMLSGFLVMHSTEYSQDKFLVKRAIKILPLYYTVTLFTFVVASIKPNWFNTTSATFTNLVKSLLFIPYVNHNGMVRPILDVAWALFPEVWFYIVFYIAMKVTYKYRALLSTSFLIVVYLCGSVFAKNNKIFGQFKLSLLYLSSGILIYSLWKHWDDKLIKGVVSKSLSVALLILFFGVSLAFNFFTRKNLSVVAFLLVVVVFATFLFTEECVESIKALIWVGSISYSLYLTHEFVVKGINRILFSTDKINLLSLMVSVISFIIALICSRFICLVFEKKIPNKLYKLIYNR